MQFLSYIFSYLACSAIWLLLSLASGQHPLFLVILVCPWPKLSPGLEIFVGPVFFINDFWLNSVSTCCVLWNRQKKKNACYDIQTNLHSLVHTTVLEIWVNPNKKCSGNIEATVFYVRKFPNDSQNILKIELRPSHTML